MDLNTKAGLLLGQAIAGLLLLDKLDPETADPDTLRAEVKLIKSHTNNVVLPGYREWIQESLGKT